jgi:hypothetical protein
MEGAMLFSERKEIVNGVTIALAMVAHELHSKGLLSKEGLAADLERTAQQVEEAIVQRNERGAQSRLDLFIWRKLAELLRTPTPKTALPLRSLEGGRLDNHDKQAGD